MKKLSLKTRAVTFELEKKDGSSETLEIREMSASTRDKYMDSLATRMRFDANGRPAGISKFDGMQASLLSQCLYRGNDLVKEDEIQCWPASVVSELFKEAQKTNHLGDVEGETIEEEIKNG